MPTAAKLVAALVFAGFGFWAGVLVADLARDGLIVQGLAARMGAVGAICGWLFMAKQGPRGYVGAISDGVRTVLGIVFWTILLQSAILMITRAMASYYRAAATAFEDFFEMILRYGWAMLSPDVLMTLAFGAVVGGVLSEWAARKWP